MTDEQQAREDRREHLRSEIRRCDIAIESGDSDPWWREDRSRFQQKLRDLDDPAPAAKPLAFRAAQTGGIPAGMKPWNGGDSAPEDWDNTKPVKTRAGISITPRAPWHWQWTKNDSPGSGGDDIVAYTPIAAASLAPRPDREAVRLKIFEALSHAFFAGRGSNPPKQYDSEAIEARWKRDIDSILDLIPSEQFVESANCPSGDGAREVERLQKFAEGLAAIDQSIVRKDGAHRVLWKGEWHEGPMADAFIELVDAIAANARAALGPQDGGGEK